MIQEGLLPKIIFMDINMPDMDGYQTTKQIRLLNIIQPTIVAVSGDPEDKKKSAEAGFNCWAIKPLFVNDMRPIL